MRVHLKKNPSIWNRPHWRTDIPLKLATSRCLPFTFAPNNLLNYLSPRWSRRTRQLMVELYRCKDRMQDIFYIWIWCNVFISQLILKLLHSLAYLNHIFSSLYIISAYLHWCVCFDCSSLSIIVWHLYLHIAYSTLSSLTIFDFFFLKSNCAIVRPLIRKIKTSRSRLLDLSKIYTYCCAGLIRKDNKNTRKISHN